MKTTGNPYMTISVERAAPFVTILRNPSQTDDPGEIHEHQGPAALAFAQAALLFDGDVRLQARRHGKGFMFVAQDLVQFPSDAACQGDAK